MNPENEMNKDQDQIREIVRRMYEAYHSRTCWICGAIVDYEEQRGSRVYAYPCGHYLWMGQARGSREDPGSTESE